MQIVTTGVLILALLPFVYYLLSLFCVLAYFRSTEGVRLKDTSATRLYYSHIRGIDINGAAFLDTTF